MQNYVYFIVLYTYNTINHFLAYQSLYEEHPLFPNMSNTIVDMYHPVLLHTIQHRIQDNERSSSSDTSAAVYEEWAGIILGVCLTNSTSKVDEGHATRGDTVVWPGGVVEQSHLKHRGRAKGGL